MFITAKDKNNKVSICLLGASFDTGNMGVSALAESSIKCILKRWPNADIILLGSGYEPNQLSLNVENKKVFLRTLPIRFSRKFLLPCHFLRFVFYGSLSRLLPESCAKHKLLSRNSYFKTLYEAALAVDITGGDSFSDMYGMHRFILGFLCKWLVLFLGKKLILLPQTYGPFSREVARAMARYIMNHAHAVYSRDKSDVDYVKRLINIRANHEKVRFAPDIAFVLDSRKPEDFHVTVVPWLENVNATIVGFNISGLLFNAGYDRKNMFGLRDDYRESIYATIEMLLKHEKVVIILIPHVFSAGRYGVESDPDACLSIFQKMTKKYEGKIFLLQSEYSHNEIKYVIGLCHFFIGSRMHSCIAALSQCIPTVGLAYSKKFNGVFESVGMQGCVLDLRRLGKTGIIRAVECIFQKRAAIKEKLINTIPSVQAEVLNIFNNIKLDRSLEP